MLTLYIEFIYKILYKEEYDVDELLLFIQIYQITIIIQFVYIFFYN